MIPLGCGLTALRIDNDRFEECYTVYGPARMSFVQDPDCRYVILAYPHPTRGFLTLQLDESEPEYEYELFSSEEDKGHSWAFILSSGHYWSCKQFGGSFKNRYEEYEQQVHRPDRTGLVEQFEEAGNIEHPDLEDLFAMMYCLNEHVFSFKGQESWLLERYPDHPRGLMFRAQKAAEAGRWEEVFPLLASMPREQLDPLSRCHACHLLGLALYLEGRVDEALEIWQEVEEPEEGRCRLYECINYALSPPARTGLRNISTG